MADNSRRILLAFEIICFEEKPFETFGTAIATSGMLVDQRKLNRRTAAALER